MLCFITTHYVSNLIQTSVGVNNSHVFLSTDVWVSTSVSVPKFLIESETTIKSKELKSEASKVSEKHVKFYNSSIYL